MQSPSLCHAIAHLLAPTRWLQEDGPLLGHGTACCLQRLPDPRQSHAGPPPRQSCRASLPDQKLANFASQRCSGLLPQTPWHRAGLHSNSTHKLFRCDWVQIQTTRTKVSLPAEGCGGAAAPFPMRGCAAVCSALCAAGVAGLHPAKYDHSPAFAPHIEHVSAAPLGGRLSGRRSSLSSPRTLTSQPHSAMKRARAVKAGSAALCAAPAMRW